MRASMRTTVNLASTASGAAEVILFGYSSESSASKGTSLGQLPLTEAVPTPSTTWQGAEGAYKIAVPSYVVKQIIAETITAIFKLDPV
jgi:hypothetical protein